MLKKISLNCVIIFITFISCSAHRDEELIHTDWPTKSDLINNFRKNGEILIIYPASDTLLSSEINTAIALLQSRSDRFDISAKSDRATTDSDIQKNTLILIGTIETNSIIQKFEKNIPLTFSQKGFEFNGIEFNNADNIIKISFYPNVFNPSLPISIITGNTNTAIAHYLSEKMQDYRGGFFWDSWGYQVYDTNNRLMIGNFSEEKETLWQIDNKINWYFDYEGKKIAHSDSIFFIDHTSDITPVKLKMLITYTNEALDSIEKFSNKKLLQPIYYHLYSSGEEKALMKNNADAVSVDFENHEIDDVTNAEYDGIYSSQANELFLRTLMGVPKLKILEKGFAVKYTPNWQRYGYLYWAKKLYDAHNFLPLPDLLNNNSIEKYSYYKTDVLSAVFVDFLINYYGLDYIKSNYISFNPDTNEIQKLNSAWNNYIELFANYKEQQTDVTTAKMDFTEHINGFNLAHEGYQIYNGYLGSMLNISLGELKNIGTNAVAIIPYSGFESLSKPSVFRFNDDAGGENDASIIHAMADAKSMHMSTMIKPQLWSWVGWTGDINMINENDWNLFFNYYEQWILHYAFIAEIYHADILCLGVELQHATVDHEKQWNNLINNIRIIYSGKITYAANWGYEFEHVTFWNKLDAIGINCYYPISDKQNPTDDELIKNSLANMNTIEHVQKIYAKPVLFTEIGFTSLNKPWLHPHEDDQQSGDTIVNEESQMRCYKAMFESMQNKDWIAGIYIWKWPSYMDYSKEHASDFTPCGKLAEGVVKKYYLQTNH